MAGQWCVHLVLPGEETGLESGIWLLKEAFEASTVSFYQVIFRGHGLLSPCFSAVSVC